MCEATCEEARAVLAFKEELAKEAEKRRLATLKYTNIEVQNSAPQGKVRDRLAELANVSHGTIAKVEYIEKKATSGNRGV